MIKFDCSSCAQSYRVKDDYAGKRIKCKSCGTVNTIPSTQENTENIERPVGCADSIAAYNELFKELSKYEKQAPTLEVESG